VDLHDMVWRLRRKRNELENALGEARRQLLMQSNAPIAELTAVKDELEVKKKEIVVLSERVRKLENERCMFAYSVAGCAFGAMYFRSWM